MGELMEKFEKELNDEKNGVWVTWLAKAELATGQPRKNIALACIGLLSTYLVIGFFAELVCNAIGMAYPAYASMKAIKSERKDDDTAWLIYWTVFAVFSLIDFFSEAIMGWFPLYWVAKVGFLFWLWCPATLGAERVHKEYLVPFMEKYGSTIAAWEAKAKGA